MKFCNLLYELVDLLLPRQLFEELLRRYVIPGLYKQRSASHIFAAF